MVGDAVIGAILALFGLALLSTADGQPQAALGVALFMGGAALLMREVSARGAIEDARAAQVEALEDARSAAITEHLQWQHEVDKRYWSDRHGWRSEVWQ